MILNKFKIAHYSVNRYKHIIEVEKWFERETSIYTEAEIYELWQYFVKRCEKDLVLLAKRSDAVNQREAKIINTANILRYCYGEMQMVLLNIVERALPML
jgi:hypothetical protein